MKQTLSPRALLPAALLAAAAFASGAPREPPAPPEPRRVAIRAAESALPGPELERLESWARRQGTQIDVAAENAAVPEGRETVRVGVSPPSADFVRRLSRFGVRPDSGGFEFDGRSFRAPDDAIALRDPRSPGETLIFGNGKSSAIRLVARRVFFRDDPEPDYVVVSGDLTKSGRFVSAAGSIAIERSADRDEFASRDLFVRSLETSERGGVRWRSTPADRAAVARFEPALARFLRPRRALPLSVRVFPDAATKAHLTGSSRPADLSRDEDGLRLDVDGSTPSVPDVVSPMLASAAFAAEDPRLLARPVLLQALGARACGRFWERDVAGFAAFARMAGVEPTVEEVMASAEEVSPLLAVGSAAAWIDAGIRAEGEPAVLRLLAAAPPELSAALRRWETDAIRARVVPPPRRPFPAGFLRGVSYAMSNSVEAAYASPRSRETILRLARLHANSLSIMPFAFQREAEGPSLTFVHRNPRGETDEGTVRAVTDARASGMTAMVKPQIWVGNDEFVGRIRMRSETDWNRWFALYRRFLVHHAIVAEASGAALFCVGTELIDTEVRVEEWRQTIAAVRLATGASLIYAANWTGGAMRVPFWDSLDAVGVDFYDPLAKDASASDASLEAGAKAAARPLAALARSTGKPIVFTEAGYPLAHAAWMSPHDENSGRPADSADAARAIAALYRALEREPWWRGVYWWKAFSSGRDARSDERGFNVLGGAPEKAMAEGFDRLVLSRGN